jgi:hypothetical protein
MNTPAPLSRRPAGFTPPRGPGRCPTCGWHTPTQGHHPRLSRQETQMTDTPIPQQIADVYFDDIRAARTPRASVL